MSRDISQYIEQFNQGRDPERLERKYAAMRQSPFVFFRGSCHLFYQDWPVGSDLDQAPHTWVCGDLHLENFGSFKGDNRLSYFDMNDFDEAQLAPVSWELARFLTSILVGAESIGVNGPEAVALCHSFLDSYRAALREGKPRWVERATAEGMVKSLLEGLRNRTSQDYLDSRTKLRNGKRAIRLDGKRALAASDQDYAKITRFMADFAQQQSNPGFFKVLDVARRIAGTGSLGQERYVILVEGNNSPAGNLLLDLKHQPGSALTPHVRVRQPAWASEAERVVAIQQRVQAVSPAFLAPVSIGDRSYVLRELLPSQDRLVLAGWNGKLRRLEKVLSTMGRIVAWNNLRSGGRQGSAIADEWVDFGQREEWTEPLLAYARQYARQVVNDWRAFTSTRTAQ